jgi:hypothetical protein
VSETPTIQADLTTVRAGREFHSGEPGCFGPHDDCTGCAALRLAAEVDRQATEIERLTELLDEARRYALAYKRDVERRDERIDRLRRAVAALRGWPEGYNRLARQINVALEYVETNVPEAFSRDLRSLLLFGRPYRGRRPGTENTDA